MLIFFRYIISYFLALQLIASPILAQRPASELAMEKACQCLSSQDLKNLMGKSLENAGDSCLELAFWPHITMLMKEFDLQESEPDDLFLLAKNLGQQLALQCPAYAHYAKQVAMGDLNARKGDRERQVGILLSFHPNALPPYFTVLDSSGQKFDYYWLREFDGSARFFDGIDQFQHTEMEVVWQRIELFDPIHKKYNSYCEIILMEEIRTLTEEEKTQLYLSKNKIDRHKRGKKRKAGRMK